MIKTLKWALLALLVYVIFLIAKLPASQVLYRFDLASNMSLEGVSGTIWQGRAATLINNGIEVENLKWDVSFSSLLLGNIDADVSGGNLRASEKVSFTGTLGASLFDLHHVHADNFTLYIPANMILAQVNLPIVADATGRLKLAIDSLSYPSQCEQLQGRADWRNAGIEGIQGMPQPLDLGNFSAQLSCVEQDIALDIKEPNRFGLNAQARVSKEFKISLEGKFKPDPTLPKQVLDAAVFFGRTDDQGYYSIKL